MLRQLRSKKIEPLLVVSLLWPLALVAPFIPGIPRPQLSGLPWRQELLMALVLLCTMGALLLRRQAFSARPFLINYRQLFLTGALLLFALWSAASLLWATNPYPVIHHTSVWGIYLLFFLLMLQAARRPRLLAASLWAFAAAIFIISLASVIGALGASVSIFRYTGLGEPMAVSVPLLTALALNVRRRRAAILCGATALLAWLAMLLAFERTAFLSTTIGLILLALVHLAFPQLRARVPKMRALLLLSCFILITALQFTPSVTSIFVAPPRHTVYSRLQTTSLSDENTLARLLFWRAALEMAREHPLSGVGASHYGIAFTEARARFVAAHPDSKLSGLLENHLAGAAHNEYLQILAELGSIGFALFLFFALALIYTAWLALRRARSPLAPGAACTLAVFAINSGASSISFRWLASGLIFFFAAAILNGLADTGDEEKPAFQLSPLCLRSAQATALGLTFLVLCGMSVQAISVIRSGQAQDAQNAARADALFRSSLFWNPLDGATRFTYGQWLYQERRYSESIPHLRFGIDNGINTALCYAYLSSAEMKLGEMEKADASLSEGLRVYPRSVFLRVRLASLLAARGQQDAAESEMARALAISAPAARGWWQLINFGKDQASQAARENPSQVSAPGDLAPPDAVLFVLSEKAERAQSFAPSSLPETLARASR
jgi:O-antigen ligase